jgi:hypothetical protein
MKRAFVERLDDGSYIMTVTSGEHARPAFGNGHGPAQTREVRFMELPDATQKKLSCAKGR